MAKIPPPARKEDCVAAIRRHLVEVGMGRLDHAAMRSALYKEFPEISRPTIFRWIDLEVAKSPSARELTLAAQAIEQRIESGAADHLPAMPSPAAIARDGGKALRNIDFGIEIKKLYSDAEMLRSFSIKEVEGDEKIRNPVAFEKSIKARAGLIETSLKVLQEIWDMKQMQSFYEMILDEIGRADQPTQQRIMMRLAALNQRFGMTMAMKV